MNGKDSAREERIHMDIIVDAHDSEERAMVWYYYLDDKVSFPFSAECVTDYRQTQPSGVG